MITGLKPSQGCIYFFEVVSMSRIIFRSGFRSGAFIMGIVLMLLALILYPSQAVAAASDGVNLSINVIVPSLFPFFVLSSLSVELGLLDGIGRLLSRIMKPLFHVSGVCAGAFLLGVVGGYPVGARTAISLYTKGYTSKEETERLLSFCNNSGPAFILGVVGAGIFSSSQVGLWLYLGHVLASVLVGILFRSYGKGNGEPRTANKQNSSKPFPLAFTDSVKGAFEGTLNICAFVIFFTVVIRLLFLTGVIGYLSGLLSWVLRDLGLPKSFIESLLTGIIEMTSGVWSLRDMAASLGSKLCMAAFILGWAGLSVHCQVLSFIGSSGLSTKTYFFGKLLHGMISALIIWLLSSIFHWERTVSAYLAIQVSTIAALDFHRAFSVSIAATLLIGMILMLISIKSEKACGNCGICDV